MTPKPSAVAVCRLSPYSKHVHIFIAFLPDAFLGHAAGWKSCRLASFGSDARLGPRPRPAVTTPPGRGSRRLARRRISRRSRSGQPLRLISLADFILPAAQAIDKLRHPFSRGRSAPEPLPQVMDAGGQLGRLDGDAAHGYSARTEHAGDEQQPVPNGLQTFRLFRRLAGRARRIGPPRPTPSLSSAKLLPARFVVRAGRVAQISPATARCFPGRRIPASRGW